MKNKGLAVVALVGSLMRLSAAGPTEDFVAHEWGTFTSVQGADGVQMMWNPFIKTDLPAFVYDRAKPGGFRLVDMTKKSESPFPSFVRMETPVIYFYSDTARTADVTVKFPEGRITEWYPQATGVGPFITANPAEQVQAKASFIEWKGVNILPRGTTEITDAKLIREKGESHYYPARETEANFLRVNSPKARNGVEQDRLLFYRGIGSFIAPLTVKVLENERTVSVSIPNDEPITELFVLMVFRHGTEKYAAYQSSAQLGWMTNGTTRTANYSGGCPDPLSFTRKRLMTEMRGALVKQGLYEREALAMVNTWQDQWFSEEGTRVLYLLPRSWTDRTLPLDISPRPAQVTRVMVGRSEVLLPKTERQLSEEIVRYTGTRDAGERQLAVTAVKELGLGRFLEPAMKRALTGKTNQSFLTAAWRLARDASNGEVKGPQVAAR